VWVSWVVPCAGIYIGLTYESISHTQRVWKLISRDGILGHKFDKRLESLALFLSQSLLLADFKENYTLLRF
jgi:hypothetical protein